MIRASLVPGLFAVLIAFVLAPLAHGASEPATPDVVTLETQEDGSFLVFASGPSDAASAILVLHDWFGVSDLTKEAVARLGARGYRVAAVDLYGGQSATTHKDAWALMQAVDQAAASRKIEKALNWLHTDDRSMALFGMSMGVDHTFRAALGDKSSGFDAMVVWYGSTGYDAEVLKTLKAPVLAIYGSKDGDAATEAAAFSKAMDAAGKHGEIYIYPGAAHAFAQPLFNAGKTYDPVAAEAVWVLTEDFLARQTK